MVLSRSSRGAGAPLRIVSYSVTPIVGVAAILARCINACTPHFCRCLLRQNAYPNGVDFEGDISWTAAPVLAEEVLANADVVVIHHGKVEKHHRTLLKDKAIVTLAHGYSYVDKSFVNQNFPGAVVGQYAALLPEYKGWSLVPNPVPLWEEVFMPGEKKGIVTICYTPATKLDHYPPGDRFYWRSKGYASTMTILEKLAAQFPLKLNVIGDRQVPHAIVLEMKRHAHIVIDECVTGSYHRNSLEGLATGCIVINAVGLDPGVLQAFRYCAGGTFTNPFTFATLDVLEGVLTSLIECGADSLVEEGRWNRHWMEEYWSFARQWESYWMPIIVKALDRRNSMVKRNK